MKKQEEVHSMDVLPTAETKGLMIVIYTHQGHTFNFYHVKDIKYHNKKLSFKYAGFAGYTQAHFNDVAGITKHKNMKNPNIEENKDKELYNQLEGKNEKKEA